MLAFSVCRIDGIHVEVCQDGSKGKVAYQLVTVAWIHHAKSKRKTWLDADRGHQLGLTGSKFAKVFRCVRDQLNHLQEEVA